MRVCVVVAPRTVLRSIRSVAARDAVNDNIDNSLEESTVDGLAGEQQPEMDRASTDSITWRRWVSGGTSPRSIACSTMTPSKARRSSQKRRLGQLSQRREDLFPLSLTTATGRQIARSPCSGS